MASAFQAGAFQFNAFQAMGVQPTRSGLQRPVNCVLLTQQNLGASTTVEDRRDEDIAYRVTLEHGGGGMLSKAASSFKTTTSSRGYD